MNEKYLSVLRRLYQTNRFKQKKVNLNNILKATTFFDSPQKDINFIHVTGTNGKGSVCKKIAKAFELSGYKTGLYISPHISSFRERIQINSKYIEKEYITDELENIFETLDRKGVELTYFEIVTLLSLIYFKNNKVDIGVMEVGLGGNLDATNIIDPLISVITSIALDHTDSLGYTQHEIAEKKSGIIKPERPVILGPDCYPKEVFVRKAGETNSEIYWVDYDKENKIYLDFDNENNEIVKKALDVINTKYSDKFHVTVDNIEAAIKAKQPCRKEDVIETIGKETVIKNINELLEKYSKQIANHFSEEQLHSFKQRILSHIPSKIFLDVGHNPHGLEKLMTSIRNEYPAHNISSVCGFSSHKDIAENMKTICSFSKRIYLISPNHPRVMPYEDLKSFVLESGLHNFVFNKELIIHNEWTKGNVELNILLAVINSVLSEEKEIIVVCGSFFIMSDSRKSLGYEEEEDPYELNEMSGNIKFGI